VQIKYAGFLSSPEKHSESALQLMLPTGMLMLDGNAYLWEE
jgi:hypothetical protein